MEKWRKPDEQVIGIYQEVADKLIGIEQRKMFGCPCAFINGNMFFGVFEDKLFLRISEDQKEQLSTSFEIQPFSPSGRVMKAYVTIPKRLCRTRPCFLNGFKWGSNKPRPSPKKSRKPRCNPPFIQTLLFVYSYLFIK